MSGIAAKMDRVLRLHEGRLECGAERAQRLSRPAQGQPDPDRAARRGGHPRLLVAFFATNRNPNQDKLTDNELVQAAPRPIRPERCAAATYDMIKRDLFRRAAQIGAATRRPLTSRGFRGGADGKSGDGKRGRGQRRDRLFGLAVARPAAGDRGGRRPPHLTSDIDYPSSRADGSGDVVLLSNADAMIAPLATLARVARAPVDHAAETNATGPEENAAASESANSSLARLPAIPARPSFDCANARTKARSRSAPTAACRRWTSIWRRISAGAGSGDAGQRALLQSHPRSLSRLSRPLPEPRSASAIPIRAMREIRDIMEGRWQSPR